MHRSGTADLPLHGGRVPAWLADRMTRLGAAICEQIICDYGAAGLLSRLSDPFWFQALGCVMGMDWHSSGITTSVLGALKRGLNPLARETGLYVCGGRGRHSRETPAELRAVAERTGADGEQLVRASRLTARVDNNAIADGFQLYLHGFFVASSGEWAVVQQGMNAAGGMARRYHWHSASVLEFTVEPHTAIVGENQGTIMNLVDRAALPAQSAMLSLLREPPTAVLEEVRNFAATETRPRGAAALEMPRHHAVRPADVDLNRLGAVLAVAHERKLRDFASLLLTEKVGPRTLQSLALVAEVIHGTPTRFSDPARFSFAHGGKDGHPFPVPLKVYDETISVLRHSLARAKLPATETSDAFCRLDRFVHNVEKELRPEADFRAVIARERAQSSSLGGRSTSVHVGPSAQSVKPLPQKESGRSTGENEPRYSRTKSTPDQLELFSRRQVKTPRSLRAK